MLEANAGLALCIGVADDKLGFPTTLVKPRLPFGAVKQMVGEPIEWTLS